MDAISDDSLRQSYRNHRTHAKPCLALPGRVLFLGALSSECFLLLPDPKGPKIE